MFDFFRPAKKKAIDELAHALANDFMGRFPADTKTDGKNLRSNRSLNSAVNSLCVRAQDFHRDQKLDLYGKARLNNTLLWALRENGYQQDLVDDLTKRVIIALSNMPKAAS